MKCYLSNAFNGGVESVNAINVMPNVQVHAGLLVINDVFFRRFIQKSHVKSLKSPKTPSFSAPSGNIAICNQVIYGVYIAACCFLVLTSFD